MLSPYSSKLSFSRLFEIMMGFQNLRIIWSSRAVASQRDVRSVIFWSFWVEFACSPYAHMGFLQLLWFICADQTNFVLGLLVILSLYISMWMTFCLYRPFWAARPGLGLASNPGYRVFVLAQTVLPWFLEPQNQWFYLGLAAQPSAQFDVSYFCLLIGLQLGLIYVSQMRVTLGESFAAFSVALPSFDQHHSAGWFTSNFCNFLRVWCRALLCRKWN